MGCPLNGAMQGPVIVRHGRMCAAEGLHGAMEQWKGPHGAACYYAGAQETGSPGSP